MNMNQILMSGLILIITALCAWSDEGSRGAKFTYDAKGRRDPFFIQDVKQTGEVRAVEHILTPKEKLAQRNIVVSSIVWDPRRPAILINDEILEEGSTIQGVIIRTIEKEYVVFEIDGELVEMPIS